MCGAAGQAGLSWRWGQDIREGQSFWDRREPEPSGPEGSLRGRGAHLNGRAARAGGDQAGRGQVAMSVQVTVDGLKDTCVSVWRWLERGGRLVYAAQWGPGRGPLSPLW